MRLLPSGRREGDPAWVRRSAPLGQPHEDGRPGHRRTRRHRLAQGDLVVVPASRKHNFVNTGENPLILYTVYGPPEHADGAVHATKEEADAMEEAGKDEPPA